ncbi:MAG TPA: DUF6760 family protein [Actinomycetes bacterium]
MPALRAGLHGGARSPGGIVGYPLDQLHEEVAIIALHFHWPYDQIVRLDHAERRRWVHEIERLLAGAPGG